MRFADAGVCDLNRILLRMGGVELRLRAASLAFLAASLLLSRGAHADVLEIDDQGVVHTRAGGAEVQWVSADAATSEAPEAVPVVPAAAISQADQPAQVPDAWRASLQTAATHYGVSPHLLAAVVWQESRWHPAAISPKGAIGFTQLMPGTAHALAVDAKDPAANLDGGAHYLRQMLDRFDGDVERALAAYNAGPGRVIRAGGLPRIAETRAYVSTIIDRLTPASSTGLAIP
jgi:soluble lytic murein transglycosylase-like protein